MYGRRAGGWQRAGALLEQQPALRALLERHHLRERPHLDRYFLVMKAIDPYATRYHWIPTSESVGSLSGLRLPRAALARSKPSHMKNSSKLTAPEWSRSIWRKEGVVRAPYPTMTLRCEERISPDTTHCCHLYDLEVGVVDPLERERQQLA